MTRTYSQVSVSPSRLLIFPWEFDVRLKVILNPDERLNTMCHGRCHTYKWVDYIQVQSHGQSYEYLDAASAAVSINHDSSVQPPNWKSLYLSVNTCKSIKGSVILVLFVHCYSFYEYIEIVLILINVFILICLILVILFLCFCHFH